MIKIKFSANFKTFSFEKTDSNLRIGQTFNFETLSRWDRKNSKFNLIMSHILYMLMI